MTELNLKMTQTQCQINLDVFAVPMSSRFSRIKGGLSRCGIDQGAQVIDPVFLTLQLSLTLLVDLNSKAGDIV